MTTPFDEALEELNKAHSEYCVAWKNLKQAEEKLEQARKKVALHKPDPPKEGEMKSTL